MQRTSAASLVFRPGLIDDSESQMRQRRISVALACPLWSKRTDLPRVRALSSRPVVALSIDVGDTPADAKALLIRGVARVAVVDGVPDEYLAASTKALAADQVAEFERQVRSLYDQMARITIQPHWARFFDFGAGRLPRFLTRLASGAG